MADWVADLHYITLPVSLESLLVWGYINMTTCSVPLRTLLDALPFRSYLLGPKSGLGTGQPSWERDAATLTTPTSKTWLARPRTTHALFISLLLHTFVHAVVHASQLK